MSGFETCMAELASPYSAGRPLTRVVCGGMNRSGSTWQFNVVRVLVAGVVGWDQVYGAWIDDYDADRPERCHVIKAHSPQQVQEVRADVTLSSIRDLRAVASSLARMKWLSLDDADGVISLLGYYVAVADSWRSVADSVMRYEQMLEAPLSAASDIASALRLRVTEAQLGKAVGWVADLRPPGDAPLGGLNYDRDTQLHAGHIGSRSNDEAIAALPPELRLLIDECYEPWLRTNGYL
jgi:hypothetical protein